mmetsp:Transcript_4470/g.11135  ORF Transcript_4470/g.11135 Transcript_4470/m.11135 type:complete len:100 (-) Transcript_4470:489-788(-)
MKTHHTSYSDEAKKHEKTYTHSHETTWSLATRTFTQLSGPESAGMAPRLCLNHGSRSIPHTASLPRAASQRLVELRILTPQLLDVLVERVYNCACHQLE